MNRHPAESSPGSGMLIFGGFLALSFALAPVARAEAPPLYQSNFATCGTAPGQIFGVWGITAGADGALYVADSDGQWVSKFDAATGAFLLRWDVPQAWDVAVAPDGSVYVLRSAAGQIDRFSPTGTPLGSFGSPGSGDGQFNGPFGISIDPQGQVFVADTGNSRIQRFAADGTFLGKWGQFGGQIGDLQSPSEVAADAFGNVYVIDNRLGRIYRFSNTGSLLGWWYLGGPLSTPITLNYGLAVDPAGNVYVTEGSIVIDKYTPSGQWLSRFGHYGTGPGQFLFAMTIACDPQGHIYVSDRSLCRITRFGYDSPVASLPTSWGRLKATYR